MAMTIDQLQQYRGAPVYSDNGEKLGTVEELFADYETDRPEWIGIGTGFLRSKRVLVPVQGATTREDGLAVPYDKDTVKASPDIDEDQIGEQTERDLYAHYGLGSSPTPANATREDADDQASTTRSEEEMLVGKRATERGRVQLHKWVETEPVSEDVEIRRETARVEREPIDRVVDGAELKEEDIEVPLQGEEAVVEKRTVAKERVSVSKDVESEAQRVEGEVRKEHVDVTGDEEQSA